MESVLDVELKPLVKGFPTHENAVYAVAVKIFYKAHRKSTLTVTVFARYCWVPLALFLSLSAHTALVGLQIAQVFGATI